MRLRNIKGANDILYASDLVINEPTKYKNNWYDYFENTNPIYVEFGMGKGDFLKGMAIKYPNINFVGFEKFSNVLVRAVKKIEKYQEEYSISNVALIRMDIEEIKEVFQSHEISRIYLNFSDPWPKERHVKKRLTNSKFLKLYEELLPEGGEVHFKTDNADFFEYSLIEFKQLGWTLKNVTRDLHNTEFAKDNVMTEYELKFSKRGIPICRLEAVRP